jgi:hypothetical protein
VNKLKEVLDKNYYEAQIRMLEHKANMKRLEAEQRKELLLTLFIGSYIIILTIATML